MFRNVYKYIVHWLTGKSELERIVVAHFPSKKQSLVRQFRLSLKRSKQLPHARQSLTISFQETEEEDSTSTIASIKRFKTPSLPGLRFAVKSLHNTNTSIRYLSTMAATSVSHEENGSMLMEVWESLRPQQKLQGENQPRESESWSEIGFQGLNPETDFRGGGVLSLENLRYFANTQTELARQILQDQGRDIALGGIPFACVGINITAYLLSLVVVKRNMDDLFLVVGDSTTTTMEGGEREPLLSSHRYKEEWTQEELKAHALEQFNRCYTVFFVRFAQEWTLAAPQDAMGFPIVFAEFKRKVEVVLSTPRGVHALTVL